MTPEEYDALVYWGSDDTRVWHRLGRVAHTPGGHFFRFTVARRDGSDPNLDDDRPPPLERA
jgi:hypothetical protein